MWARLRPLVLRLHFYAGILVAPFVVVAALSGLVYVWTPQVENALYDDLLRVPEAATSVSLAEQVRLAEAEVPGTRADEVRPATDPGDTTRVLLDVPGLDSDAHSGGRPTVFVDPHRGEVVGVSESYGTSGALPVRTWVSQFHRHLHLGEPGRVYSELAASWVWVVAAGGLALWVGRSRRRGVRALLLPRRGGGRGPTVSRHAVVGVWLLMGVLMISATGLTWSAYAGGNVSDLRTALSWTTPTVATDTASAAPGVDVGVDTVLDEARGAGLDGPVSVEMPADHVAPYVVTQLDRSWPTRADSAALAQDTGAVVDVVRFADHPLMAKLSRWGVDLHMGLLFGVPNQILLTVTAGGLVYAIGLGYRAWWQRRPTRGRAGVGRPHPRGSFLSLSWPLRLTVVAIGAALGWALPVLGVSLLLFLLVDTVLGWRAGDLSGGSGPRSGRPDHRRPRSSPAPEPPVPPRSGSRNRA
ncbi:PepSY domain-containing protein [Nocardiopsis sp. MG754419]|nr:PepSY domain-containing protein [Nocardiopsis sp. MG754419]